MRFLLLALTLALLGACSAPAVPDQSYFRMPAVDAATLAGEADHAAPAASRQAQPLVVEPFRATGVYNDQSILYALSREGSIKAYHYQLWDESPSVLLQRRLIATLRARNASTLVTDRLPAAVPALRIGGNIEQFERVQSESGWSARVRLELRVDHDPQSPPLLLKTYAAEIPADTDTIQSSVRAFARAVDQCLSGFWADFAALPPA